MSNLTVRWWGKPTHSAFPPQFLDRVPHRQAFDFVRHQMALKGLAGLVPGAASAAEESSGGNRFFSEAPLDSPFPAL